MCHSLYPGITPPFKTFFARRHCSPLVAPAGGSITVARAAAHFKTTVGWDQGYPGAFGTEMLKVRGSLVFPAPVSPVDGIS